MVAHALYLLGSPHLDVDGTEVHISRRKVMALLAYLAVTGNPHTRDALATFLWPERDSSTARAELRRHLSLANRYLGGAGIEADRETVQLDPDLDLWLDVVAFRAQLGVCESRGHAPMATCPDCLPLLKGAVALYGDGFMAGFGLEDSAAFDEWQFFEAEALKDEVASALVRLATYYASQGDFERAIGYARRWLAADPLHEPAHRHLMVLYAKANQRTAALRQYETCCQVLQAELGVEPSARTQETHQQVLGGKAVIAPAAVEAVLEHELRTVGPCPYRGLAAFREADAPFFFGRETFVERLERTIASAAGMAMVVGASGSGKSSLIQAGLLSQLRTTGGWVVAVLRPGREPFHALATALCSLVAPDLSGTDRLVEIRKLAAALESGALPLFDIVSDAVGRSPASQRLLLWVDQFEELYTLGPEARMRRRFVDALLQAMGAAGGLGTLTLLLTLRADFMGQALAYRPFADALQTAAQMLGPMTREELRAAIEKPAEAQGAAFEHGLVARLLDDVGDEPGNLPLLQFALTLLWERLDFGWLTHAAYEAIGRVAGALARHADEVYEALSAEDQVLCRRIFTQLVQPGEGTEDTRRVAIRTDVGDAAWSLVQRLADQRLVVTNRDELTGAEMVEVVHEALIGNWGRLQAWMAEDRAFRTWQERLRVAVRTWEATDNDEGALLRGVPLAEAEQWLLARNEDLSAGELAFVAAGIALRERRAAEREVQHEAELEAARQLAEARDQAVREREEALRQAAIGLASEAKLQMQGPNPDVAVLLALEAVQHYPYTSQAEQALAEIVLDWRLVWQFCRGSPVSTAPHVSPDGTRFLTASNDGVLRVWDLASGANRLTVQAYQGTAAALHWAHWSPAGDRILTHSLVGGRPRVWAAESGALVQECALDGGRWAEWSPDGTRILSYWGQQDAAVWDAQTGQKLRTIPHSFRRMARFSPDGRWVATNVGEVWDAETGELHSTLQGFYQYPPGDATLLFTWSPDGRSVGSGLDGSGRVWDIASGEEILRIGTRQPGRAKLWWSPGGDCLLTLAMDTGPPPIVWDATTGVELVRLPLSASPGYRNPWSPEGDRILLPDERGHVTLWEAATGRQLLDQPAHTSVANADWLPDGSGFVTTSRDLARVWRISTTAFTQGYQPELPCEPWAVCPAATWSPQGTRVARAFNDGTVRVWDVPSRTEVARIRHTTRIEFAAVNNLAWSPDGERILTGAVDGAVEIWDSVSGARLLALEGHGDAALDPVVTVDHVVIGLAWAPDGRRALSCGRDRRAVVWDTVTGEALTVFTGQEFDWGAWSPDGQRIVLVGQFSFGGPVKIWNAETGEALLTLLPDDFAYGTSGVAWSPDGGRIVTFSLDGVGRLWDAATATLLGTFVAQAFTGVAQWSPTGERFLAGGAPGGVRVWNAATLEQVVHYVPVPCSAAGSWSSDGKAIAIGYANGDTKVFPAWESLADLIAYAKAHCVLRELTPEERTRFGLLECKLQGC